MSNESLKAPSQIFRWFEKMKSNYEQGILSVLDRFEKNVQNSQALIEKCNNDHITSLKFMHEKQLKDKDDTITSLQNDLTFYRNQLIKQQEITEQLNSRYDAVMNSLISEKRQDINIRDIFENDEIDEINNVSPTQSIITQSSDINDNVQYEKAIELRASGDTEQAFFLLSQISSRGHVKAMGALARAYFLCEGTNEDQCLGLAWLIKAASLGHEPAIKRSKQFQEHSTELYQEALNISETLISNSTCVIQNEIF